MKITFRDRQDHWEGMQFSLLSPVSPFPAWFCSFHSIQWLFDGMSLFNLFVKKTFACLYDSVDTNMDAYLPIHKCVLVCTVNMPIGNTCVTHADL